MARGRKLDWDEARRLRAEGLTYRAIAERCSVVWQTVSLACNEEARLRDRRRRWPNPKHAWRGPANSPERFWSWVEKTEDCWLWCGHIKTGKAGGYGQFGQPHVRAHRFAYELLRGAIPAGLHLDHLCNVKRCVNPWHLEPVTPAENYRRARRLKVAKA